MCPAVAGQLARLRVSGGSADLRWRVVASKSALSLAVVANVPSDFFSGGMEFDPPVLRIMRALESRHQPFGDFSFCIFAFVLRTCFENSWSNPALHSSRICANSGVPAAACLASSSRRQRSEIHEEVVFGDATRFGIQRWAISRTIEVTNTAASSAVKLSSDLCQSIPFKATFTLFQLARW